MLVRRSVCVNAYVLITLTCGVCHVQMALLSNKVNAVEKDTQEWSTQTQEANARNTDTLSRLSSSVQQHALYVHAQVTRVHTHARTHARTDTASRRVKGVKGV